jgi:hypothetical protein
MKVRVFKRSDDSIIYEYFNEYTQTTELINSVPVHERCSGLPSIVCNDSDIPSTSDSVLLEQIYVSGEFTLQNILIDSTWDNRLMPNFLIRKKRIEKIGTFLSTELAKTSPDLTEVMKKNLEKTNLSNPSIWIGPNLTQQQISANDLQMAQLALSELDARVANGEPDKPVIRQKLEQKIQDLT